MKSKYYFPHTATVFFLLTVAVALFSWIGSIYGLGKVQSLLSPEGIRWELRHAMGNFVQTPALGIVMMLFLGFGITVHSGVWGTLGRIVKRGKPISRKEKRALILAGCILLVYIIMIICSFIGQNRINISIAQASFIQRKVFSNVFRIKEVVMRMFELVPVPVITCLRRVCPFTP